jgi:hypothetical protein
MLRVCSTFAAAAIALPLAAAHAQVSPGAPPAERLGQVQFSVSCAAVQNEFNRAVAMLHSFWFPPANATFRQIAAKDPQCGMAWWGVAMVTLGNPLAGAPTPAGLKTGWDAVQKAQAAGAKTERERDYIAAIAEYYRDSDKIPHRQRALAYEKAMERLATK